MDTLNTRSASIKKAWQEKPSYREKVSESSRQHHANDPAYAAKVVSALNSPESIAKRKATMAAKREARLVANPPKQRLKMGSPEYREMMRRLVKQRHQDPAYQEKFKQAHQDVSEETRQKIANEFQM